MDGSEKEYQTLTDELVDAGTLTRLTSPEFPNSFAAFSDPADVARVESRTFICSENERDAGFTNNWVDPEEMRETLSGVFEGAMKGRTMYVIPFVMGHLDAEDPKFGVEITDSGYVVTSMRIMARIGTDVLRRMEQLDAFFVPAVHSVGSPLDEGQEDVPWPCNEEKYIVHFPETREIWSYGSGYGGNALLGKKCYALRIASAMARDEGWLAEHMVILKLTSPKARATTSLRPSPPPAARPTSLSSTPPSRGGRPKPSGTTSLGSNRGRTASSEPSTLSKLLRRRPRHRLAHQRQRHAGHRQGQHRLHQLRPHRRRRRVVGGDDRRAPAHLIDWQGNDWTPDADRPAAHPNARFCTPIDQTDMLADEYFDPEGVKLDAILFGGRRKTTVPLVTEARDWNQGIFFGATLSSETTAAQEGAVGNVRRDPMAMLPFIGYDAGDYLKHWVEVSSEAEADKLPKIFLVNWFRRGRDGKIAWPGFSENTRVLKWIIERLEGTAEAQETVLGHNPTMDAIDTDGLDISEAELEDSITVRPEEWKEEVTGIEEWFDEFGDSFPHPSPPSLTSSSAEWAERPSAAAAALSSAGGRPLPCSALLTPQGGENPKDRRCGDQAPPTCRGSRTRPVRRRPILSHADHSLFD